MDSVDGETLYGMWAHEMLKHDTCVDSWDELESTVQQAWNSIAEKVTRL